MPCTGNSKDHCCYINNVSCQYVEKDTVPGRIWACGLRRELGDWDKVLNSTEYKTNVEPVFGPLGINCRDWPNVQGQWCGLCGENK